MARLMKNSGIQWIGDIPQHWEIRKVKQIFKKTKRIVGKNVNMYERLALTLKGVIKRSKRDVDGLQPKQFEGYQILKENELVFKLIDLENINTSRVGISSYVGIVSPAYIVIQNPNNDNKYYYYWFMYMYYNEIFNHLGGDGVRSSLNADDLLKIDIPNPPLDEQQRIANYLDEKCSKIDETIEKEKAIIEKLKEYKQSLITETVTKGVNPNVPLKDSNNIYFSNIPKNWNIKKIKYIFFIKKDIANQEGYNVLSITQKGIKIKDLSKNEGQLAENYSKYQIVNIGDFAMNHMDLLTGGVDISNYNGVTSPDYRVFKLLNNIQYHDRYYLYIMKMCYFNKIFYSLGQGVSFLGRWRLQADKFLNFTIPVPPIEEQKEIAKYLDEKCNAIENAITQRETLIDKLTQYKKSLIYECVTGKKEI